MSLERTLELHKTARDEILGLTPEELARTSRAEIEKLHNNFLLENPVDYQNLNNLLLQLHVAAQGPKALAFALEQAQYILHLRAPIDALEYLINGMRKNASSFPQYKNIIEEYVATIFRLAIENFSVLCYNQLSFSEDFNRLMALFPQQKLQAFQGKKATPLEALRYLLGATKQEKAGEFKALPPTASQQRQENIFQEVIYNFTSIYTSGPSSQETFEQLLALFPTKKTELIDQRNKFEKKLWETFAKGVADSVNNRNKKNYPYAQLNPDKSISLFILKMNKDSDGPPCANCGKNCMGSCRSMLLELENVLKEKEMAALLADQCKKHQFPLIKGKEQILEVTTDNKTDIVECRVNLSPDQLDILLKPQPIYAYRNEGSVLKLIKSFSLKEGVIMLSPVLVMDKEHCMLRSDGCQMSEMPSLQLRNLLPDYDGVERYFHWIPPEVTKSLALESSHIENILNELFFGPEQKREDPRLYLQGTDGMTIIANPNSDSPLKIVDIDENARNFYALYGNCDSEELQACKSIEVSTLFFLQLVQKCLRRAHQYNQTESSTGPDYLKKHYSERSVDLTKGLETIEKMIKTEEQRIQAKAGAAPHIAPHSSLYSSPSSTPQVGEVKKIAPEEPSRNNNEPS